MKKYLLNLLLFICFAYICTGCLTFSVETKGNLSDLSNLSFGNKDIDINIVENGIEHGTFELTNYETKSYPTTIHQGDILKLTFEELTGFNNINGTNFPGMDVILLDSKGNIIDEKKDTLSDYENGVVVEEVNLFSFVPINEKFVIGEPYKWKTIIYDKKGTGKIEFDVDFVVR